MFDTTNWPYIPAKWQKRIEGKRSVRLIVIHDMEAAEKDKTAENVARYFSGPPGPPSPASAHLCIDSDSIVQCVKDNNVASAAPGVNHDGIHLELAGFAKQTEVEWLDPYGVLLLANAADATAQYCLKYNIPPVHLTNEELKAGGKGIIGHYQASKVYPPNAGHNDPGPGFPWNFFIERVAARLETLKKGVTVVGTLKTNSAGNPISILAEEILLTPERQLPTIAEMSGLVHDFTDGRSMKEYMEELSDE